MQGKWWFPMALGLVTYTPCQYHAHQYQVQQLLEGIRLVYIFKQLNGVSGNVDFWMFRAHKSSLAPLIDTVKHMATEYFTESLHQASTWIHENTSCHFNVRTIFIVVLAGHRAQQFIYIIHKVLLSWQDSCLWSEDVRAAKPISLRALTRAIFSQHAERRNVPAVYKGTKAGKQLRGSNSNWPVPLFLCCSSTGHKPNCLCYG